MKNSSENEIIYLFVAPLPEPTQFEIELDNNSFYVKKNDSGFFLLVNGKSYKTNCFYVSEHSSIVYLDNPEDLEALGQGFFMPQHFLGQFISWLLSFHSDTYKSLSLEG